MAKVTDARLRNAPPGSTIVVAGRRGEGRLMYECTLRKGQGVFFHRWRQRLPGLTPSGHPKEKDQRRKIGSYPAMTMADAIEKFNDRAADPAQAMRRAGTFDDLLDTYVKSLEGRGAASAKDTKSEFQRSVKDKLEFAAMRKKEAREITPSDIKAILAAKHAGGATARVNRLRSMLSAAFAYTAKHDYDWRVPGDAATFLIGVNPVASTPRAAEYEQARSRVLTKEELLAFWKVMEKRKDALGAFWRLVMLSGQRALRC
jgi:hypothetical protein